MTPRLSGHFFYIWFGFLCAQVSSGIARQWSCEKFAILTPKPRSHVRILIYRTWAIIFMLILLFSIIIIGLLENVRWTGSTKDLSNFTMGLFWGVT